MDHVIVYVLLIVFLASFVRSTFGFGESLIAVPLLALAIPVDVAVPLAVLLSVTIAFLVVMTDWHEIHMDSAWRLIVSTLLGIPLGLLLLKFGNEKMIKMALGLIIVTFSTHSLLGRVIELKSTHRSWTYGCGFIAGILGGAFGMNGPPLVVYGSLRGWSPSRFRATLHAYFLPASAMGAIGYWWMGLITKPVSDYYLWSLMVVLPAIFMGKKLNGFLPEKTFKKIVFIGLIGVGVLLMFV